MGVNINLKEVFSTDSQSELTGKLNFNFNQLIALGVGQPGQDGPIGPDGGPGPIGPIGPAGENGSVIWSTDGSTYIDLSTGSPEESQIGDYYIGEVTVEAVTYNGIYKKESEGTVWTVITDFAQIFSDALSESGGELFPWRLGVITQTPPARIIIPINSAEGIDRINISYATKPADYYLTYQPNWKLDDEATQNSHGVIFNFDTKTAKQIVSNGSADVNGYYVKVSDDRLGLTSNLLNEAFPYTALLSLYSFYDNANAGVLADQINGAVGYRHQLELGSVDDLIEALHDPESVTAKYVISPTYQNLRIRKYRKSASYLPGEAVILGDFNLHSTDSTTDPALNSKLEWTINKKMEAAVDSNAIISMALSNSDLEGSASSVGLTGLAADGLHLKMDAGSDVYKLAVGFDPTNVSLDGHNFLILSDGSITKIVAESIALRLKTGSLYTDYGYASISAGTGNNLTISATDATKELKLGQGMGGPADNALRIKGTRLSSNIPFATSTGTVPTYNSTNVNTLDEYQEGTFTPTVNYGGPMPDTLSSTLTRENPTISNNAGTYVKIGKLVTFTISFDISAWTVVTTDGYTSPPYFSDSYYDATVGSVNVGKLNETENDWEADMHPIGEELYQIKITDLSPNFNHWPDPNTSENMKFSVSLTPSIPTGFMTRPFPMTYSWSERGISQFCTAPMQPMDPSSIYARFTYDDDHATNLPQLSLFGIRQHFIEGSDGYVKLGTMESNLSIYDFLNYVHETTGGNTTTVTIHGSYITNHQTAQTVHPYGATTTTTTAGMETPTTTTTTESF